MKIQFLLIAAAVMMGLNARGQQLELRGYGLYDCHVATGGVAGAAAAVDWHVNSTYQLTVGAEYVSSNRIAAKLEGSAVLVGDGNGRNVKLVNSYLWRQYPRLDVQEFTGALQVAAELRHCKMAVGLCNRYNAPLIQRSQGGNATVVEPMNVLFALEGWWNDVSRQAAYREHAWNIGLRWSSYNDFVIERVANWFFSLKGYYALSPNCRLTAEVGTHPVGSLNLTCSYNGWFCHVGGGYVF